MLNLILNQDSIFNVIKMNILRQRLNESSTKFLTNHIHGNFYFKNMQLNEAHKY